MVLFPGSLHAEIFPNDLFHWENKTWRWVIGPIIVNIHTLYKLKCDLFHRLNVSNCWHCSACYTKFYACASRKINNGFCNTSVKPTLTSFAIVRSWLSNTQSWHLTVLLLSKVSGKQTVSLFVGDPSAEDEFFLDRYRSQELGLSSRYGTALRNHSVW
jgi:hypothetical protein